MSAHQANLSISPELLTKNIELPLPRFQWSPEANNKSPVRDLIELNSNDLNEYKEQIDLTSTDSEVDSDTLNVNASPDASSAASDSPTPTNSVQDKGWAVVSGHWQGLVSEEQRQLLGNE